MQAAKKQKSDTSSDATFLEILSKAKPSDSIKKLFLGLFDHGPALLEHFLQTHQLLGATKIKDLKLSHSELATTLVEVNFWFWPFAFVRKSFSKTSI